MSAGVRKAQTVICWKWLLCRLLHLKGEIFQSALKWKNFVFLSKCTGIFLCGGSYSRECLFSESRLGDTWECIREVNVLHTRTGPECTSVLLVTCEDHCRWPAWGRRCLRDPGAVVIPPGQCLLCKEEAAATCSAVYTPADWGSQRTRSSEVSLADGCIVGSVSSWPLASWKGGGVGGLEKCLGISGCKMLGNLAFLNSENSPDRDA